MRAEAIYRGVPDRCWHWRVHRRLSGARDRSRQSALCSHLGHGRGSDDGDWGGVTLDRPLVIEGRGRVGCVTGCRGNHPATRQPLRLTIYRTLRIIIILRCRTLARNQPRPRRANAGNICKPTAPREPKAAA